MKTIKVDLGEASYPLFIGNDVLDRFSELLNLYRFPDHIVIMLQKGISAQFIPASENALQIEIPSNINLINFESIEKFFDKALLADLESGITLMAVGDDSLLNFVSFGCQLLTYPPVLVRLPTTLWAMAEFGVKDKAYLNWKNRPSMISISSWPQMVVSDLHSLQNTSSDELFLFHANVIRNLLLASSDKFDKYEDLWQEINFDDEELLVSVLEFNAKTRIAIIKQGSKAQYLIEDFGVRAINSLKSNPKLNLKARDKALLIFLDLRWRLKLSSQLQIEHSGEFSRILFLIEKILAIYHVKQDEWDKARDLFLQSLPIMLNNIYIPASIGKMQKLKSIERTVGETCLVEC